MDVTPKYKVKIEHATNQDAKWITFIRYYNQLGSRAVVNNNGTLTWQEFAPLDTISPTLLLAADEQDILECLMHSEAHEEALIAKEAECVGRIAEIQAKLDETTTQSARLSDRLLGIIETLSQPAPPPVVAPAMPCNYPYD